MYSDAFIGLSGRVTRDPWMSKAKETPVCIFPLSVRTGKRDENGHFKTDYYKISVFDASTIEYTMKEIKTGARVRVCGFQTLSAYTSEKDNLAHPVGLVTAADVKLDARPRPEEPEDQTEPEEEEPKG